MKAFRIGLAAGAIMIASAAGVAASSVTLEATIRDFTAAHPNFGEGSPFQLVTGAVETTLGPDGKPVFAGPDGNRTQDPVNFTNADDFNEWFNDSDASTTSSYNMVFDQDASGNFLFNTGAPLTFGDPTTNDFQVVSLGTGAGPQFFPLGDDTFFFTLQVAGYLTWENVADVFRVQSDDDLWMFINGKLVVDMGGVRAAYGTMFTGAHLDSLGFAAGESHRFDLFFAERNREHSVLSISTNMTIAPIPLPASGLLLLGGLAGLGFAAKRRRHATV
jgi:fibro-slime domain-containing protein